MGRARPASYRPKRLSPDGAAHQGTNRPWHDQALFYRLFATGVRPLEVARLEVRDYLNEHALDQRRNFGLELGTRWLGSGVFHGRRPMTSLQVGRDTRTGETDDDTWNESGCADANRARSTCRGRTVRRFPDHSLKVERHRLGQILPMKLRLRASRCAGQGAGETLGWRYPTSG